MFSSSSTRHRLRKPGNSAVDTGDAPREPVQLTSLAVVPGVYSAYGWKNIAFVVWFGPATLDSLAKFDEGCRLGSEKHPQGVSSVHVMVPGGGSMPSADARAELARIMRKYADHSAATAVLLRGKGFWASALTGMITALSMLAPRNYKLRIFNDPAELAQWLPELHAERTGVSIDADELSIALQLAEATGIGAAAA